MIHKFHDMRVFDIIFVMDQLTNINHQQQTQTQSVTPNQVQNNLEHLPHPNLDNQTTRRNSIKWMLHILVPVLVFVLYLVTYNKFKITVSEMIKTTGLWSITLLSVTLLVGPLSKYIKIFNQLKIHRKFWGITSFCVAITHFVLVLHKYYQWDIVGLLSFSNPKVAPVWAGLIATILLFLITITSNKKSIEVMGPKKWKLFQTMSYLALGFVILHFYLAETKDGVLVIKRFMGRFALVFGIVAILVRLAVFAHVEISKKKNKNQQTVSVPTVLTEKI